MSIEKKIKSNPADEYAHSKADLAQIGFLTIWHQIPYLTTRRLAQLNCIKKWSIWCPYNIKRIAKARREDDTTDWYFPLFFWRSYTFTTNAESPSFSWSWKGTHLSSGKILQAHPCALPSLTHLPLEWTSRGHPCFDIIAGSSGLLLIKLHIIGTITTPPHWQALIVSNPLTKEWRVLPAADCRDVNLPFWDYRGIQAHMVVDDEANLYKVILAFRNFVCIYKSASNNWTCKVFLEPGPWGYHEDIGWGYVGANTCVGGRLYFADLEVDGITKPVYGNDINIFRHGNVRVFEIDEEVGTWKAPTRYALQNFILQNPHRDHGFRLVSYALEIVECMGGMYAVIPAKFEENMMAYDQEVLRNDFVFMPLQFHILQLQGVNTTAHGVLRIQIPITEVDNMHHSKSNLLKISKQGLYKRLCRNWFRCTARGSVIWVTSEDYLLQYDVLSGQSKTWIIENFTANAAGVSFYRPSFHMKP